MAYTKPMPDVDDPVSKPFWEGAKEGKFRLPRCTSCNRVHWYPRLICPHCHAMEIEWFEASGEGRLYSFAVQHRAPGAWADEVPFVTAYIDLEEGDRIFTVLRGVDPNQPQDIFKLIGAKCRVEWDEANEQVNMPYWRVVEQER